MKIESGRRKQMKTVDIPKEHRDRAREILLEHFGGEFPLYFINLNQDKFYINVLGSALTRKSCGEITPQKFLRIRDQALGQIEVLREWKTFLYQNSPYFSQLDETRVEEKDSVH